jgi:hypothetical protein
MNTPDLPRKTLASALAAGAAGAPAEDAAAHARASRTRLWELEDKHHCPVIGTCLPVDDLARLARRFFAWIDSGNAFAMHVEAVNLAKTRNAASEAMQALLERRYRLQVQRFKSASDDGEVMQSWREHYARGDVAGALWAAITHRAVSAASRHAIFADVHMLSHQVGAGLAADTRRLAALASECADAQGELARLRARHAAGEVEWRRQLRRVQEDAERVPALVAELARASERLAAFESGEVMVDIGRKLLTLQAENSELVVRAQRAWTLEKNLQAAHHEARALARERDQLAAERDALERLISLTDNAPAADDRLASCDGECVRCDPALAGQCVLYVGGRSALLGHYRALAERLGFRLLHHDGGVEESVSRLPEMINGADAVVCPTDCVSHSAYYQVKRQCKRSGKPCLLLKSAGVSGFAVALARLAAGQSSLPLAHGSVA